MKTKTEKILAVMNVLAWILYPGPVRDLSPLRMFDVTHYSVTLLLMATMSVMEWVLDHVPGLKLSVVSGDFIVMAGVVFITAQIFKKGVELQTENELTV